MTCKSQGKSIEITHESSFLFNKHIRLLEKDGYKLRVKVKHSDGTFFAKLEK